MTESKELSQKSTDGQIYPNNCPICGVQTNNCTRIEDSKAGELSSWFTCQCGVTFQEEYPGNDIYNDSYMDYYGDDKQAILHQQYAGKLYAPIIEELTYGRMMLDVGFGTPTNMQYFADRGWLTWGIDVNENISPGGAIYKGDFLGYDFDMHMPDDKAKELGIEPTIKRKFDLLWMSHCIEHMEHPIKVLKKAYDLLSETGVLYLSTPDTDFINKTGVAGYPHFKKREHYIMWTERALKRELERIGFKVIMCRRNFSSRFISWYDVQIIVQKNYF